MPTFSEDVRNQDDPIILRLSIFNIETEEWEPDKKTLKVKATVSPKLLLHMQDVDHDVMTVEVLAEMWAVILEKASAEAMAELLDSDTHAADMGQLNTSFQWALEQLGLKGGDDDPT